MGGLGVLPLDRRLVRVPAPGSAVRRAWTWRLRDVVDRAWWPQGATWWGSGADARLLVAWYSRSGGSRVSVLDLARRRYAHVPLLGPTGPDGAPEPLAMHAGGLAATGSWLHVAATYDGLWSFHADDLTATSVTAGWVARARHRPTPAGSDEAPLRWSFVGLGADGASLVAGEYGRGGAPTRLARVALDDGLPVGPLEVLGDGPRGMQGAVDLGAQGGGGWVLSTSHGPWGRGSLWTGRPGAWTRHADALPMGPEDLAGSGTDPRTVWTATEHPWRRWVVEARVPGARHETDTSGP